MKVTQHSPGINPWLESFGCSTLALIGLVGKDFTVEEVNEIYKEFLDAHCYLNPDTPSGIIIWQPACQVLNKLFGTSLMFLRSAERDYVCLPGEKSIDHYYISLKWPDHFTLGNEYDPSGTGNAWRMGILLNKRIIKV